MFIKISQNSQLNTCARVSVFNKVAGLSPATLWKQRLWHRSFPVNFAKCLRTPFFTENLRWLLQYFQGLKTTFEQFIRHSILTHFMSMFSFCGPWKHQITSSFRMFSGGITGNSVEWIKLDVNNNVNFEHIQIILPLPLNSNFRIFWPDGCILWT